MAQLATRTIPVDEYGSSGGKYRSTLVAGGATPPVGGESPYPASPNTGVANSLTYVRERLAPEYGAGVPAEGEVRTLSNGIRVTRLTDIANFPVSYLYIVYSRYTPENTNGQYVLVFGPSSTESWVIDRNTRAIIATLQHTNGSAIGENHEVRWDISGNHPNRIYYRNVMGFYMIDDVTNPSPVLIRDFSAEFPASTRLYNDVEGDSSNDSRWWAWMATHYNGTTYVVDGYIAYDRINDVVHTLTPDDLAGSNLSAEVGRSTFSYRPNMVEISPSGSGFVMHHGRKWDDSAYGGNGAAWIDTWYDGPHLWPLDFDFNTTTPRKMSVGETHAGWAWGTGGEEYFVSQNNRTDQLDAVDVNAANGYANRLEVGDHASIGWSTGWHYGKMPPSHDNWQFVNTYANRGSSSYDTGYGVDQFWFSEMKNLNAGQKHIALCHNHNWYDGNYRDEAPAAINGHGNRIYVSINWGGQLDHPEVFLFELPDNWKAVADAI
ncbi:MAG: hypothetical protein ACRBCS_03125 [Cellvibrionaceae bacterium]